MHPIEFYLKIHSAPSPAILVGSNGSGKSRYLLEIAQIAKAADELVFVISNTVFDRFKEIRYIKRISAAHGSLLPFNLLKKSFLNAIEKSPGFHAFGEIGRTLQYCGYKPTIGFKVIDLIKHFPIDLDERFNRTGIPLSERHKITEIIDLLLSRELRETQWLNFEGDIYRVSLSYDLSEAIALEKQLRKLKIFKRIEIFLDNYDQEIPINQASSGQLSLIATFVFLATTLIKGPACLLIDEPENSLHPQWQKEYVERLSEVIKYRDVKVVIATHAPILVSGAMQMDYPVSIFQVSNGIAHQITTNSPKYDSKESMHKSVEEVLWESFQTITPANHYVSQLLVQKLEKIERGEENTDSIFLLINKMRNSSFDDKQIKLLDKVKELATIIEEKKDKTFHD